MRASLTRIVACFLMLLSGTGWSQAQPTYDAIITNGTVVDGTGNAWFHADIGIRDGASRPWATSVRQRRGAGSSSFDAKITAPRAGAKVAKSR